MKLIKRIMAIALSAALGLCIAGCGDVDSSSGSGAAKASGLEKTGKFVITLYPEYAPISCENFESLVSSGFYDGLTFHRVVDGFMAQGGDPKGNGNGGSDKKIKGEFSANGVNNTLSHKRGIVSMARSKDPDSASSQFFICYDDVSSMLDGKYAAFGEVTEGMEVVDEFLKCERKLNAMGEVATPVYPITITKAVMLEAKEGEPHRAEFTVTYSPRGA